MSNVAAQLLLNQAAGVLPNYQTQSSNNPAHFQKKPYTPEHNIKKYSIGWTDYSKVPK